LTNNDIFRRLHLTFDFDIHAFINIFSLVGYNVKEEDVTNWLKKDKTFVKIKNSELALFLNGFIELKRGAKEGDKPKVDEHLNNNIVLQKLRIALNLKAEDMLEVLKRVNIDLSKHELSAFFRKPTNRHYRECTDQLLQSFLQSIHLQSNDKKL
jgi:uncharacterized protein YehS (DUF1456 family)